MDVRRTRLVLAAWAVLAAALAPAARAQSSSLFGPPDHRQSLTLAGSSWSYLKVDPPKEIQMNDIITVVVSERQTLFSQGLVNQRKQSNINAQLQNWLKLDGFGVTPAPQKNGDPQIQALLNTQYRTQSQLQTQDSLLFRIACRVVDIRPNGNLVLEGHSTVRDNEEIWDHSLTGIIRREDVLPNNTVLSENIAELSIFKREKGQMPDAYQRGWFLRLLDRYHPF